MSSDLDRGVLTRGLIGYSGNKITEFENTIVDGATSEIPSLRRQVLCSWSYQTNPMNISSSPKGEMMTARLKFSQQNFPCSCPKTGLSCTGRYGYLVDGKVRAAKRMFLPPIVTPITIKISSRIARLSTTSDVWQVDSLVAEAPYLRQDLLA